METLRSSMQVPVVAATDNRREIRLACNAINVKACFEGHQPVDAWVVEVSKSGIGLVMYDPAPVRALVRIVIGDLIVKGDVRHCRPRADNRSYAVGVSIHSVSGLGVLTGTASPEARAHRARW